MIAPMARVLCLAQSPELGGAELALLRIARRLPDRGFEPQLTVPAPGPLAAAATAAGIEVHQVPLGGLGARSWAGLARGLPAARRLVRRVRPDLVYLNGAVTLRAWPALGATTAVTHLHDLFQRAPRPFGSERFWRSVPVVMCASGAVAESAAAAGAPGDRLRNVGTPVEISAPAPRPEWAGDGPVVGFAGRIEPLKGVLELLAAAPAVLARRPDTRFVLAGGDRLEGSGEYRREVERRAGALGDRVLLLGPVADATALMPWFDALAVPSLREAFGTVAAEALATGTPAVVTASGGMSEYVTGDCGAVVAPGDAAALGQALLEVLDAAPGMSEAAKRAAAPFAADRVADLVAAALGEALGAASTGSRR